MASRILSQTDHTQNRYAQYKKMSKKNKKEQDKLNTLIVIFLSIISIWVISIIILSNKFENWTERGTFGDSFGAINALFSGLAFGGIIYTILLQRKELKLQREELTLTRKELKRTANAQELSNKFQSEQIRLSNIPIFQFETRKANQNFLLISNESGKVAFDVDIWFFIIAFDDEYPKDEFIENFVKDDYKKIIKKEDIIDQEVWAIAERGIYSSFPNNSRIVIPLEYPIGIDSFEILIQYRDSLNNNYSQKIKFDLSQDKTVPFKLSHFEPKILQVFDRIELHEVTDREKLPEHVKWIHDLHKSSIFSAQTKDFEFSGVESRWIIKKIKQ